MADKFTKKAVASADAPADSWKDIVVEKESHRLAIKKVP